MLSLAVTSEGWRPAIGDPTVVGWVTVFAYLLAAVLCWRAAARCRGSASRGRQEAPLSQPAMQAPAIDLWTVLAAVFVLLAINKQLDLQSWLTEVGRAIARSEGWYEHRRTVQAVFVVALAAGGLVALLALAWLTRRTWDSSKLAVVGATFIVIFVVIRAASFHHLDALLGWKVLNVPLEWGLEIGGIACVALAAAMQRVAHTQRRETSLSDR
jgi:hypothetical protein